MAHLENIGNNLMTKQSIEEFGSDLEALYNDLKAQVGKDDLEKIKNLHKTSWRFHNIGRVLIHISLDPLTFMVGVLLLSGHYVMEFTNGHNVMHGHYDDIINNGKFNSNDWQWNNTMPETTWKFEHHVSHHPFTNILGKDHDYGYLLFRMNQKQEWQPRHLAQLLGLVAVPAIMNLYMPWYISTARAMVENREILTWKTYGESLTKFLKKSALNYLFYPFLAGPFAIKVAAGNFLANLISNAHMVFMLAIEHHDANLEVIEAKESETKAEYYLRQILATRNYRLPGWYEDMFTGSVNIHIEHHLWPDLPFNRLKQASPEVEAICRKYGVPYHYDSFSEAFWGLMNSVFQQSIPTRVGEGMADLIAQPVELIKRMFNQTVDSWLPLLSSDLGKEQMFVKTRILKKTPLNKDTVSLELAMPNSWKKKDYRGGQYISLQLRIGGKDYVRQYSLTKPAGKNLHIAIKRVKDGLVSNFIHDKVAQGEQITLVGNIKGEFICNAIDEKRLFLAAGVGITPIISMLREIAVDQEDKAENTLLYFNHNEETILFEEDLAELSAQRGLTIKHFLSQPSSSGYVKGRCSKELLLNSVKNLQDYHIYICAPNQFIDDVLDILQKLDFNDEQIHFEKFRPTNMISHKGSSKIRHKIRFLQSNREIEVDEQTTLLEAIERAGISIPSGCRQGLCKACLVRKDSGHTQLEEFSKKNENIITTCNSFARSDMQIWL